MIRQIKSGKQFDGVIQCSILSEDELQEIHQATLEILMRTGMYVEDYSHTQGYAGK